MAFCVKKLFGGSPSFDANPDPDPNFNFDADQDPDLDPDPTTSFRLVLKNLNFFSFIHSIANLHCFIFLVIVKGVISSLFWKVRYLEIFWEKYSLALHLIEMGTRIRKNDADPTKSATLEKGTLV